jgi:hypothetical protein
MTAPTPNEDAIDAVLRSFLLSILPSGVEVIGGQDNRVSEPAAIDFVMMTPSRRGRIATNIDTYDDAAFTASIAGTTMTVSAVALGTIQVGRNLFGAGITAGTVIASQISGPPGGAGTYGILPGQTVASETMAAGAMQAMQETMVVMQIDVHGPNSADNAQVISTLMRDDYAVQFFKALSSTVAPLYADDPKQIPFVNDQQQYEDRWVIEAMLQANQTVPVPQQFADVIGPVVLVPVEATYPP